MSARSERLACVLAVSVMFSCGGPSSSNDVSKQPSSDGGASNNGGSSTAKPQTISFPGPLSGLAISDDGRVIVAARLGSTTGDNGERKMSPMYAYERDGEGNFNLLCELPSLQRPDFSVRGALVALSSDGSVVVTEDSSEGQFTIRGFRRSGGCFEELPEPINSSSVEREAQTGQLMVARDGSNVIASYPMFDQRAPFDSSKRRSGSVRASWSAQNRKSFASPDERLGAMFGSGIALADSAGLLFVGEQEGDTQDLPNELEPGWRGFVYVYELETGTLKATLHAEEWRAENESGVTYGRRVAASEDGKLIVAATSKALYTFERVGDSWQEKAKITPTDPSIEFWGHDLLALSSDGSWAIASGALRGLGETKQTLSFLKREESAWTVTPISLPADLEARDSTFPVSVARTAAVLAIGHEGSAGTSIEVVPLP